MCRVRRLCACVCVSVCVRPRACARECVCVRACACTHLLYQGTGSGVPVAPDTVDGSLGLGGRTLQAGDSESREPTERAGSTLPAVLLPRELPAVKSGPAFIECLLYTWDTCLVHLPERLDEPPWKATEQRRSGVGAVWLGPRVDRSSRMWLTHPGGPVTQFGSVTLGHPHKGK